MVGARLFSHMMLTTAPSHLVCTLLDISSLFGFNYTADHSGYKLSVYAMDNQKYVGLSYSTGRYSTSHFPDLQHLCSLGSTFFA